MTPKIDILRELTCDESPPKRLEQPKLEPSPLKEDLPQTLLKTDAKINASAVSTSPK
jgi:hypothetical protein